MNFCSRVLSCIRAEGHQRESLSFAEVTELRSACISFLDSKITKQRLAFYHLARIFQGSTSKIHFVVMGDDKQTKKDFPSTLTLLDTSNCQTFPVTCQTGFLTARKWWKRIMFQMNVNKARIDLGLVWGDRALLLFCEILQFLLEEFSIIYSLQTPPPTFWIF